MAGQSSGNNGQGEAERVAGGPQKRCATHKCNYEEFAAHLERVRPCEGACMGPPDTGSVGEGARDANEPRNRQGTLSHKGPGTGSQQRLESQWGQEGAGTRLVNQDHQWSTTTKLAPAICANPNDKAEEGERTILVTRRPPKARPRYPPARSPGPRRRPSPA